MSWYEMTSKQAEVSPVWTVVNMLPLTTYKTMKVNHSKQYRKHHDWYTVKN